MEMKKNFLNIALIVTGLVAVVALVICFIKLNNISDKDIGIAGSGATDSGTSGKQTVADTSERLGEICERVCRRASLRGRNGKNVKVRALRPGDSLDGSLLEFLKKGGWDINGFANRDLDMFLNGGKPPKDAADKKRRSAKATRLIRLLRAHKLVVKVNGRNKYRVTEYGHKLSTAIALAKEASVKKLGENVA